MNAMKIDVTRLLCVTTHLGRFNVYVVKALLQILQNVLVSCAKLRSSVSFLYTYLRYRTV